MIVDKNLAASLAARPSAMSLSRHILKKPFTSLATCVGRSCEAAPSTVLRSAAFSGERERVMIRASREILGQAGIYATPNAYIEHPRRCACFKSCEAIVAATAPVSPQQQ